MTFGIPVGTLQKMMSVDEFFEYVAYDQLEPFGAPREDMRAAILPHMLATAFTKKGKAPKIEEFVLSNMLSDEPKPKRPRQTLRQMETVLKSAYLASVKK